MIVEKENDIGLKPIQTRKKEESLTTLN